MRPAAWSEGVRSGLILGICAVLLAIIGLAPSFSWVPEALLLGVAIIVPIAILARAGSRAAAKANGWPAGALAGAVSGSIGGLVGGAAYVFFGKPALNLVVGLVLGSIGGAGVGAMAAITTRFSRRSRPG